MHPRHPSMSRLHEPDRTSERRYCETPDRSHIRASVPRRIGIPRKRKAKIGEYTLLQCMPDNAAGSVRFLVRIRLLGRVCCRTTPLLIVNNTALLSCRGGL